MTERNIRSFNVENNYHVWLERWKKDSGLSLSSIINMLILEKIPSSLTFTGRDYEFVPWKTAKDLPFDDD